jgi:hypothetical protein
MRAAVRGRPAYAAETAGTPIQPARLNTLLLRRSQRQRRELDRRGRLHHWTPTLLRSAYNYQWVAKDRRSPWQDCILQVLYDNLQALGGYDQYDPACSGNSSA